MNNVEHEGSRELETKAAASRQRLSGSLDELANNLTPGRVLDEVMSYSRGGGADFLRGLRNAAAANPIPAMLIGAGCAMFLSGRGRLGDQRTWWGLGSKQRPAGVYNSARPSTPKSGKGVMSGLKDSAASMASSVSETVSESAANLGAATSDAVSRIRDSAADAATTLAERGRKAGAAVRDYAGEAQDQVSERAGRVRDEALSKSRDLGRHVASFVEEQPLVAAAGGFLLGAAVAALLPKTQMEDSYFGETSDAVKKVAGNVASEQFERAKTAASEVVEKVKDAAEQEGFSTESVQAVANKVQNVVQSGSEAMARGTDRILKG
jgi:ElaB/YqjD/DUF883 family membrane-anchored ribosome-binding protein